jgi:hypothetical protein
LDLLLLSRALGAKHLLNHAPHALQAQRTRLRIGLRRRASLQSRTRWRCAERQNSRVARLMVFRALSSSSLASSYLQYATGRTIVGLRKPRSHICWRKEIFRALSANCTTSFCFRCV